MSGHLEKQVSSSKQRTNKLIHWVTIWKEGESKPFFLTQRTNTDWPIRCLLIHWPRINKYRDPQEHTESLNWPIRLAYVKVSNNQSNQPANQVARTYPKELEPSIPPTDHRALSKPVTTLRACIPGCLSWNEVGPYCWPNLVWKTVSHTTEEWGVRKLPSSGLHLFRKPSFLPRM